MKDKNFYLLLAAGLAPFYINDLYNPHIDGIVFWFLDSMMFAVIPAIILTAIIHTKYVSFSVLSAHYSITGLKTY